MGRHGSLSKASAALPLSIFSRLYARLAEFDGAVIPLQIGDTIVSPPSEALLGNLGFCADPKSGLYNYSSPRGLPEFLDTLVAKVQTQNGFSLATPQHIQLTSGCTHALSCAVRATLDPGEEIILLTPHWPLIRGIAHSCCVVPVEAPVTTVLRQDPTADVAALIARHVTKKTAAIYLSNPNNPDGFVYSREQLMAIAQVAIENDLWVISDEVYEKFVYDGKHISIATLPQMWGRTITAFSFSKSFALAGLRVGYCVGPKNVIDSIQKMVNATIYSVPKAMQVAALSALRNEESFLPEVRSVYEQRRDASLEALHMPVATPMGATYLFLDLSDYCRQGCAMTVLEQIAEKGVLLAPGEPFGKSYAKWARLCFTAVELPELLEGIERVNHVLADCR